MSRYGFEPLLVRQLDVAADRGRAGVARAAVGRLHQAAATAGDDRVAGLPERGADRARQRVDGCVDGIRAEPKIVTAGPERGQRIEAHRELRCDRADQAASCSRTSDGLIAEPAEQLLVERRRRGHVSGP